MRDREDDRERKEKKNGKGDKCRKGKYQEEERKRYRFSDRKRGKEAEVKRKISDSRCKLYNALDQYGIDLSHSAGTVVHMINSVGR